jgi:PAS domain S-box-containing protein
MPIIVYFISIILTCSLSGLLTAYAWRQRTVPGSRAFSGLELSVCLLALSEILSILSPSSALALFWFQVRYIAVPPISIFWLIFALEYSGRKDLLSRRLQAGLFIIPIITQIMLWSNSLFGLWAEQDASFHQMGIFWIADPTARIPNIGYVTHSIYALMLLLIGIVLLFNAAWRMRHPFRWQAILVAAAAMIAFITALVVSFNLIPRLEFNPFTPGIGMSVLLIALAVFQFQFLKHAPAADEDTALASLQAQSKRSLALFALVFVIMSAGIAATGYISFQNYEQQFRRQAETNLSSIASLKINELQAWRKERIADAQLIYKNPAFVTLTQRYLEDSNDIQAQAELQAWLDRYKVYEQYDRVFLLDPQGHERLSSPSTPESIVSPLAKESSGILGAGQISFLDFHRDAPDGPIHLALAIPIYAGQGNHPLGILVLRINPYAYLYPFIQQSPLPSTSAETLLIRRNGNDALYLNELKFKTDTALNMTASVENKQLPAALAVAGEVGIVEGVDYRGVPVIADLHAVPDSPWFLVTKMDISEVFAPLRDRLWQTLVFFGMLLTASGSTLGLLWRQQRARFYRDQAQAAQALRASEDKFKYMFDHSIIGKSITLPSGDIEVNQAFCDMVGYSPAELKHLRWQDITHPNDIELTQRAMDSLLTGEKESVRFIKRFIRKDGNEIWVDVSSSLRRDKERNPLYFMTNLSDINARKLSEEALHASEIRYRRLFEAAKDGILILDAESGMIMDVNPFMVDMLGFKRTQFIEKRIWELGFFKDIVANRDHFAELQQKEYIRYEDMPLVTADGRRIQVEFVSSVYQVDHHKVIQCNIRDMSERKQAEDALRKSEERFRKLLENLPVSMCHVDVNGQITFRNERFVQLFGYTQEDVPSTGAWWIRAFPDPHYRQKATEIRDAAIRRAGAKSQDIEPTELRVTCKNGDERVVEISGITLDNELLVTFIDLTERKRAEEALRESERKYRLLFDEMLSGLAVHEIICDPAGKPIDYRFLSVNAAFEKMTGLDASTIIGKTVLEVLPNTESSWIERYGQVALGRTPIQFESASGGIGKYFEVRAFSPEPGKFAALFNDITERKLAEDALRESEERYRNIFNHSIEGIYQTTPEGRYRTVNPAFARMFGYESPEEMMTAVTNIGEQLYVDPTDRQRLITALNESDGSVWGFEAQLKRKDGSRFWISINAHLLQEGLGQPRIIEGSCMDITERKQQEAQILADHADLQRLLVEADQSRRALLSVVEDQKTAEEEIRKLNLELEQRVRDRTAQLQAANQELEAFAYSVSHDLRAPLRALDGFSAALLSDHADQVDKQGKHYLNRIQEASRQMGQLINDLLNLSRVTRSEFIHRSVDLSAIAHEIAVELQAREPQRPVEFIVMENILVQGDAHLLRIALENLMNNAWKFTSPRSPGRIEIGATERDGVRSLFVRDNGVGFDMAYADKLFAPFQRLHGSHEFPGTGIGLATVQRIIARHGGRIWPEAGVGQGATFYFTLEGQNE